MAVTGTSVAVSWKVKGQNLSRTQIIFDSLASTLGTLLVLKNISLPDCLFKMAAELKLHEFGETRSVIHSLVHGVEVTLRDFLTHCLKASVKRVVAPWTSLSRWL